MANYLFTNYKGKYRLLPRIDMDTNDFARDVKGNIDEDSIYISCYYGNEIWYYGLNDSHRAMLGAYIPSKQRGHNITKELKKQGIEVFDYDETDEEVTFHFLASDMETIASLLKPKTSGADMSPFSVKNLPKSDVELPPEYAERYKAISSKAGMSGMSIIKDTNNVFLSSMEDKLKKKYKNKKFSCYEDMRRRKMSRQFKEYVYTLGMFDEYLEALDKAVTDYYNNK